MPSQLFVKARCHVADIVVEVSSPNLIAKVLESVVDDLLEASRVLILDHLLHTEIFSFDQSLEGLVAEFPLIGACYFLCGRFTEPAVEALEVVPSLRLQTRKEAYVLAVLVCQV